MARNLLIFDGDCGFCTTSVDWVARRFRDEVKVEVVPWQRLPLDDFGLSREEVALYAWWLEVTEGSGEQRQGVRKWRGHRAAGKALRACRGVWPWLGALLLTPPPLSWLWAVGYRLVARFRGYLPGTTPACKR